MFANCCGGLASDIQYVFKNDPELSLLLLQGIVTVTLYFLHDP